METWVLITAIAALAFSAWATWRSYSTHQHHKAVEARLLEHHGIDWRFCWEESPGEEPPSGPDWFFDRRFRVHNHGPDDAHNVRLEIQVGQEQWSHSIADIPAHHHKVVVPIPLHDSADASAPEDDTTRSSTVFVLMMRARARSCTHNPLHIHISWKSTLGNHHTHHELLPTTMATR